MGLIVDGHNLIGRLSDMNLADANDEQVLVERLRRYRARTRQRIVAVFDHAAPPGTAPNLSGGGVEVLFARADRTADALILERLGRERTPQAWTVVTADRRLATQVHHLRAHTLSPEEFSRRLTPAPATHFRGNSQIEDEGETKPSIPNDIDEWLKVFSKSPAQPKSKKKAESHPASSQMIMLPGRDSSVK